MNNTEDNAKITIDWVIGHLETKRWKDEDREKAKRLINLLIEQEVCRARLTVLEDTIKRFEEMSKPNG